MPVVGVLGSTLDVLIGAQERQLFDYVRRVAPRYLMGKEVVADASDGAVLSLMMQISILALYHKIVDYDAFPRPRVVPRDTGLTVPVDLDTAKVTCMLMATLHLSSGDVFRSCLLLGAKIFARLAGDPFPELEGDEVAAKAERAPCVEVLFSVEEWERLEFLEVMSGLYEAGPRRIATVLEASLVMATNTLRGGGATVDEFQALDAAVPRSRGVTMTLRDDAAARLVWFCTETSLAPSAAFRVAVLRMCETPIDDDEVPS